MYFVFVERAQITRRYHRLSYCSDEKETKRHSDRHRVCSSPGRITTVPFIEVKSEFIGGVKSLVISSSFSSSSPYFFHSSLFFGIFLCVFWFLSSNRYRLNIYPGLLSVVLALLTFVERKFRGRNFSSNVCSVARVSEIIGVSKLSEIFTARKPARNLFSPFSSSSFSSPRDLRYVPSLSSFQKLSSHSSPYVCTYIVCTLSFSTNLANYVYFVVEEKMREN